MNYDCFDIITQIELEKQYSKLKSQVEADRLRVQQQMQTAYLLKNIEILGNAFCNTYKEPEPFITVYKSKPIRGIVLELQTLNPEFIERRKYE